MDKLIILLIGLLTLPGVTGELDEGLMEEQMPVNLKWGVDESIEMGQQFEGLWRHPEGEQVDRVHDRHIEVTWDTNQSYILPMTAYSDHEMEGVRYLGWDIPLDFEVEWLNPWEREWHSLDDVPEELVEARVKKQQDTFILDFGPPEGARFREDLTRFIWFRVTPQDTGAFEFQICGYKEGEAEDQGDSEGELNRSKRRVTNIVTIEGQVH